MMNKNKIFCRSFFLLGILLLINIPSFAVPAIPFQIEMKQPDGDRFQGYIKGDEWFNWRETTDGKVIIQNRDTGFFEFAVIQTTATGEELAPSGIVVTPQLINPEAGQEQNIPVINRQDLIRLWRSAIQNMKIQK